MNVKTTGNRKNKLNMSLVPIPLLGHYLAVISYVQAAGILISHRLTTGMYHITVGVMQYSCHIGHNVLNEAFLFSIQLATYFRRKALTMAARESFTVSCSMLAIITQQRPICQTDTLLSLRTILQILPSSSNLHNVPENKC